MTLIPISCNGNKCGKMYKTVPAELTGAGDDITVVIGEAPYYDEVEKQIPFIGRAGQLLRNYLDLEHNKYLIMNSIMCMPTDTAKHKPTPQLILNCTVVRQKLLDMVKPGDVIMCLGRFAQLAMFDYYVDFSEVPYIRNLSNGTEVVVFANYHPMAQLYNIDYKDKFENILRASGKFKIK